MIAHYPFKCQVFFNFFPFLIVGVQSVLEKGEIEKLKLFILLFTQIKLMALLLQRSFKKGCGQAPLKFLVNYMQQNAFHPHFLPPIGTRVQ